MIVIYLTSRVPYYAPTPCHMDYCRPGWNDHVDELHQMARDKFVVWVNEGKPRHGLIFNDNEKHSSQI